MILTERKIDRISLVFFIRVIENVGFFSAISRCFYLIKGHWWHTFGYLFVMAIIQMFIGYAFQIPLMIYSESFPLLTLKSQESNSIYMIGYVVTFLFYLFGSQILHLLNLTALAFQYFNLVEIKEGVGLMNRINKVGNTKINKDDAEDF